MNDGHSTSVVAAIEKIHFILISSVFSEMSSSYVSPFIRSNFLNFRHKVLSTSSHKFEFLKALRRFDKKATHNDSVHLRSFRGHAAATYLLPPSE